MKRGFDLTCYLIAGRSSCGERPLEEVVRLAVEGGVTMVQLREKGVSTREYLETAGSLKRILAPAGVPLVINDRIDVALAVGAEGVHVGQSDMPVDIARRLMGPDAIIGLSMDTDAQVLEAETLDVDYLGLGPVFPTSTKADHSEPLGFEGFARRRGMTRHPSVAIGSVTARCAGQLRSLGADGLAVVSAICRAEDPAEAARELRRTFAEEKE